MSSSYKTAEQIERWHIRDCARCGRRRYFAARWPDGYVCRTCEDKALRTRGTCPGCGTDRMLPGLGENGTPICADCAGISRSYFCDRCRFEGPLHTGRLCARCTFTDKVASALDDGTGQINPILKPFADHLIAMPDPWTGWMWLRLPHNQRLLSDLATGRIPLTHETLHQLPNWRTAAYVRDLLMASGVLPVVDKQLLHFESLITRRFAELGQGPHRRVLHAFAIWHLLPKLRKKAERRPLPSIKYSSEQFTQAHAFLRWLDERGRDLSSCRQSDLDACHANHREYHRAILRGFLLWAMEARSMPRLSLPKQQVTRSAPMSQHTRLTLIRRAVTTTEAPLPVRAAACVMLIYAQPLTRISRLTIDDLLDQDGEVLIRLGEPPSPVPEPVAALLLEQSANRSNMNTATNSDSRWLFPGRRAGQPLNPGTLREQLRQHGYMTGKARPAALRQLVLQAPAPVIAQSLGFHDKSTTRIAAEAGGTWNRYAPGDHTRR